MQVVRKVVFATYSKTSVLHLKRNRKDSFCDFSHILHTFQVRKLLLYYGWPTLWNLWSFPPQIFTPLPYTAHQNVQKNHNDEEYVMVITTMMTKKMMRMVPPILVVWCGAQVGFLLCCCCNVTDFPNVNAPPLTYTASQQPCEDHKDDDDDGDDDDVQDAGIRTG